MPTDKQINFALVLLNNKGYSTDWMGSGHKSLPGATMKRRSGKVIDWLKSMTRTEISNLIDFLKD